MSELWLIVENNKIINHIVAESEEIAKELFPNNDILEDDGVIGIGWEKIDNVWKSKYPDDGLDYVWNSESKKWEENSPLITDMF
jgi:hypothetical protein